MIEINTSRLPKEFPAEVFVTLNLLRQTLSRSNDGACRPIIATFLSFTVQAARNLFRNERLAVHTNVPVLEGIELPGVGLVSGTLDFMTTPVLGKMPMGYFFTVLAVDTLLGQHMGQLNGQYATPDLSTFVVLETKYGRETSAVVSCLLTLSHG